MLLGVVGALNFNDQTIKSPAKLEDWLTPVADNPFHDKIKGQPDYEYFPYYEIQDQRYTCYPIVSKQ